jgi:hypothetical protein
MEQKLTINPIYQPCWISYLGSVSGVHLALGNKEHDLVNTGGYTGYAFALPNVSKGTTCPSGPTALDQMWKEIMNGTEDLGCKIRVIGDYKPFPTKEELTSEDHKRAQTIFNQIKDAIDNNNPVVLWGIPIPEYGIVNGYQGKNYMVSTFRRLHDQPDNPIAFDAIQAPGSLHAVIFEEKFHEMTNDKDRISLQRAIILAEGKLTGENHVAGSVAYEEWARVLVKGNEKDIIYHGNSYVNECTLEAKILAAEFLTRLTNKYEGESFTPSLLEASIEYKKIAELLKSFQKLFPFAFEGDISKEKRVKGAQLLRDAIPHEDRALKFLKIANADWK